MPETKTAPFDSLSLQIVTPPTNEIEGRTHVALFLVSACSTIMGVTLTAIRKQYFKLFAKDLTIGTLEDWCDRAATEMLKAISKIGGDPILLIQTLNKIQGDAVGKRLWIALQEWVSEVTTNPQTEEFLPWLAGHVAKFVEEVSIGQELPKGWNFTNQNLVDMQLESLSPPIHRVFNAWLNDDLSSKSLSKKFKDFGKNRSNPAIMRSYFEATV